MPRSWPGVCALFSPGQLIPGYEHYTGQSWSALMRTSPATGGFILLVFRLVGALNIAVALPHEHPGAHRLPGAATIGIVDTPDRQHDRVRGAHHL